ncbi:MAG: hypothetical protein HGN29_08310 [Asgard group archaeon]|nr:hypothetical protein [Asgard group archaeon]
MRQKHSQNFLEYKKKIPKARLLEDYLIFRESLEAIHPSIYRYRKQEEVQEEFNEIRNKISYDMISLDFFTFIAPLISFIGDGHTNIIPSLTFMDWLKNENGVFPLKPIFIENKFFINHNYTNLEELDLKCEILYIDSFPINEIVKHLFDFIQIDGIGDERKYRKLENVFQILYSLVYGVKTEFQIEFRKSNEKQTNSIRIKSMTRENIEQIKKIKYPEELYRPLYNLRILNDRDTAVLKIRSFLNGKKFAKVYKNKHYKNEGKLNKFLKHAFKLVKKKEIHNLIIDIRDNDGGKKTNSAFLYRYLSDKTFKFYKDCYINKNCFDFLKRNNKKIDSLITKTLPKLSIEQNYYKFENYFFMQSLYKTHKPKKNRFSGVVYIILNGRTFSAAGEFAAICHNAQAAAIVGEETSAGYLGNTAGHIVKVELPASKIRIFIPILQFNNALEGKDFGRGIIPQYSVEKTIEGFSSGKDTELEFIFELIQDKRNTHK